MNENFTMPRILNEVHFGGSMGTIFLECEPLNFLTKQANHYQFENQWLLNSCSLPQAEKEGLLFPKQKNLLEIICKM